MIFRTFAFAALLLPSLAAAQPNYTFIQGAYLDHDQPRDDDAGLSFAGSVDALPLLALIADHSGTGDFDHTSAGLLFHAPLLSSLHIQLGGTFESMKVGSRDDNGEGVRGGLRWRPVIPGLGELFELAPEARRVYIFNDHETSYRLSALVHAMRSLDFFGSVQGGDDERFELGARFNFPTAHDFAALERERREQTDRDAAERLATYDMAYRATQDALRDAARQEAMQKAAADQAAAERLAAARKLAAEKRAAARAAAPRRKPETAKTPLECTPECCARLETLSQGQPSSNAFNGLRAK